MNKNEGIPAPRDRQEIKMSYGNLRMMVMTVLDLLGALEDRGIRAPVGFTRSNVQELTFNQMASIGKELVKNEAAQRLATEDEKVSGDLTALQETLDIFKKANEGKQEDK